MRGMSRTVVVGSIVLLLGSAIGIATFADFGDETRSPVCADFCFIIRNPDLIGSRRFITYARITPTFPHAPVLVNDQCPKRGAGFTEQLDRRDFDAELNQRFRKDPYSSVPVSFEGTLYRPSLVRRLWFGTIRKFGFSGDQAAPITIRAYRSVGEEKGNSGDQAGCSALDTHP